MNLICALILIGLVTVLIVPTILFLHTLSIRADARNGWQSWVWEQSLRLVNRFTFAALGALVGGTFLYLAVGRIPVRHGTLPGIPDHVLAWIGLGMAGLILSGFVVAAWLIWEALT